MALSAAIQWECRTTATANNVNGGGFKAGASGTDYSQQNAAQWNNTDGASTASTTFTSAGSTFTSAIVGNVLHLTAGTGATVGWYEVTAFTDANTITLDRTSGTYTGATFYVGGAMSMNSTLDDDFFEVCVAGNKVWVKAGSFTIGEAVSIAASGGTQQPIIIEGYNTTRGDVPIGSNCPTFTLGANSFTVGTNWDVYNMIFTGTASNTLVPNGATKLVNCKVINTSTTANRNAISAGGSDETIFNCEAVSYRGYAFGFSNIAVIRIIGCYFHDSKYGIARLHAGGGIAVMNCIIESNVSGGYGQTASTATLELWLNNTFYGGENKTGIGMDFLTGTTDIILINNIFYGFVTGVNHADVQTIGFDNYNDYFNNTTDVSNWTKGANDSVLNPTFTNVAQVTGTTATYAGSTLTDGAANFSNVVDNQDFIYIVSGTGVTAGQYLITSHTATTVTTDIDAGENVAANIVYQVTTGRNFAIGTNLKALGFPGAFQAGLTIGYMDIGAVQRQEAGGGTTTIINVTE